MKIEVLGLRISVDMSLKLYLVKNMDDKVSEHLLDEVDSEVDSLMVFFNSWLISEQLKRLL